MAQPSKEVLEMNYGIRSCVRFAQASTGSNAGKIQASRA